MERLGSSEGVITIEGSRDKLKANATASRLRINCRMTGQLVPGGHILQRGTQEVEMLDSDLRAFMRTVDDEWADDFKVGAVIADKDEEGRIERARDLHERALDEYVADNETTYDARTVMTIRTQGVDAALKKIPDLDEKSANAIREMREQSAKTSGLSMEGAFFREYYRGIKPIVSVEVLSTAIDLSEDRAARKRRAGEWADALHELGLVGRSSDGDKNALTVSEVEVLLQKQAQELRAEFAKTLDDLTGGASKKK